MRLLENICWLLAAAFGIFMLWKIFFTKTTYAEMIVMHEPQMASIAAHPSGLLMIVPMAFTGCIGLALYLHQRTNP